MTVDTSVQQRLTAHPDTILAKLPAYLIHGRQELRVWDWWSASTNEEYGAYFAEIEQTFESENPDIDIVFQIVPFEKRHHRLAAVLRQFAADPPHEVQPSVERHTPNPVPDAARLV